MGITERRERDAALMKRRILDAAMHLFTEGGLEAVSMRRVAERIEYSPATIYLYFRNKVAIARELRRRGFEILIARQQQLAAEQPERRLRKLCRDYLRFAATHPRHYEIMFLSAEARPEQPDPQEAGARSWGMFRDAVAEWLAKAPAGRQATGIDPEAAALSVWGTIHGLAVQLVTGGLDFLDSQQHDEVLDEALEFALR